MPPSAPSASPQTIDKQSLKEKFSEVDVDNVGLIDSQQFMSLCRKNFKSLSMDSLMTYCSSIPDAGASLEDFTLFAVNNVSVNSDSVSSCGPTAGTTLTVKEAISKRRSISKVEGATTSSHHSIDLDELEQFILHIGSFYKEKIFSIDKNEDFFSSCSDGILLSLLMNNSIPDTIDERCLNVPAAQGPPLNLFQMTENNNLVINSAKGIGCSVINIGSEDLIAGKEHLILGLVWQIIKRGLLAKVSLQVHPELFRLLENGEDLQDLLALPADAILIRWVNYHIKDHMTISNLSTDLRDSKAYTLLLHSLMPLQCSMSPLENEDLLVRAEEMLKGAERIDCRRYITPSSVVNGNPRLNLAFVANLFNKHPGLKPLNEEEEGALIDEGIFSNGDEGDREAKVIALWLNSLNVTPFVQSIYRDLSDGLILLQAWRVIGGNPSSNTTNINTNTNTLSRFKMIENCNASVKLGLENSFSLVGIQGADICDRSPKLTLSLCWQMMRLHILDTLSCSSGKLTDSDILGWANEKLDDDAGITSFRDPSLKDGSKLLKIIEKIRPGIVDWSLYDAKEEMMNAKYIISITRKMGASIFCLPEDLVELRSKLILSLIGGLMVLDKKK